MVNTSVLPAGVGKYNYSSIVYEVKYHIMTSTWYKSSSRIGRFTVELQYTYTFYICNIYNMRGRVVSDIQARAEGEWLYI